MKFTCRKLIENVEQSMGSTNETIWAYILKSAKDTKSGRYRIRISRFTREQLRMISPDTEIELPDGFQFGLQANLDYWDFTTGWQPMLDWMGDPETSDKNIQRTLNEQLRSFLTGKPTSEQELIEKYETEQQDDHEDEADTRASWVKSKIDTPPKKVEPVAVVEDESSEEEEDSDDEWI